MSGMLLLLLNSLERFLVRAMLLAVKRACEGGCSFFFSLVVFILARFHDALLMLVKVLQCLVFF